MKRTCFAIMPFTEKFNDIDRIVEKAASKCGLEYVRGDRRFQPGSILPQILHDIRQAAVIVADITEHNPNVFYELGIAHQVKGPDRVVLVTQAVDEKKAYDVHQFRQLVYAHTAEGRARLLKELPDRLHKAMDANAHEEFWNVLRGRLPRTRMLVRELRRIVNNAGSRGLQRTTIRIAAGLSSLAIVNRLIRRSVKSIVRPYWPNATPYAMPCYAVQSSRRCSILRAVLPQQCCPTDCAYVSNV